MRAGILNVRELCLGLVMVACALSGTVPAEAQERCDSVVVRFLEEKHHVRFTDNNSIVPLESGREKFADLFTAVRAARESIHLEYFNFRNDSISAELFTLLAQKAKEGVEVRALFDGFGNASNNRPLKARHLRVLREHGIEIYEFDPMRFPWINHAFSRDHRKIVVIDGMVAYIGGMNVAEGNLVSTNPKEPIQDVTFHVQGPVVDQMSRVFEEDWIFSGKKHFIPASFRAKGPLPGKMPARIIPDGPDADYGKIEQMMLGALTCAQKTVQIVTPYFLPENEVRQFDPAQLSHIPCRSGIEQGLDKP